MRARLGGGAAVVLLGMAILTGRAVAQTKQEHEQHHPADTATPAPATPPPATTPPPFPPGSASPTGPAPASPGMPMMDMERMTGEMGRMMQTPQKKPALSRLLDRSQLSERERNTLRADAERRVQDSLQRIDRAAHDLARMGRAGDVPALARVVDDMKAALADWEAGRAVLEALAAAEVPQVALRWFKTQMNIDAPAVPRDGVWGLSWRHAAGMAAIILVAMVAVALHAYRVGRSVRLLARLGRSDGRS